MGNSKTLYLAVDPGFSGKCAISYSGNVRIFDCPEDVRGMAILFKKIMKKFKPISEKIVIGIEFVHATPLFGVKGCWVLGGNYYAWEMAFSMYNLSFITVPPKKWQELIMHEKSAMTEVKMKNGKIKQKYDIKEKSWRGARKLFPQLADKLGDKVPKKTSKQSNYADTLCILAWLMKEYS